MEKTHALRYRVAEALPGIVIRIGREVDAAIRPAKLRDEERLRLRQQRVVDEPAQRRDAEPGLGDILGA